MSIKDGSVLYVNNASLISGADGQWYSIDKTARIVVGDATVDTTKTGFDAVTKAGYTAQWYRNSQFTGDSATEISKTENSNRSYPTYYAKWTLAVPTVTVSADKTYISSGETSTLTATTQHGLAGVTYEYQWYAGNPDSGSGTKIDGATSQSYSVSSLTQASTYYCEVTAVNGEDKSEVAKSEAVTITPANAKGSVTITNDKDSAIYGDAPFTFSYTASGDATVTSSDPSIAAVSDNNGTVTVTIAGAGIAEISVDFAGSTEYSTASDKFTLTVAKATLTITADNKFIYVGDTLPTYTYTVSGLVGDDRLTTEPTVTCTGADANKAGTYTITATGADAGNSYTINYVDGTLTVRTPSSGGGSSSSGNVSGSGDNVSVTASSGSVSASQMERAVEKADSGETITIKATSHSSVSLPAGAMADAMANNNDVLIDLRYGEVILSATAIEGLTDGAAASDRIEVSMERQTSSRDEEIAELLDSGAVVFDVTVAVDDTEIHSFDGRLTITLTVSNLSSIDAPHVLHLLTDGSKEYYEPDSISGNELTISGIRNLSLFAVIPGSQVPADDPDIALPFVDVASGSWYEDAVWYVYENGLMAGTSDTTFEPDTTTSRGMIVTVLYRLEGAPAVSGSSGFTDVADGQYYADAVAWASSNGIVGGYGNGLFGPNAPITREQMAVILYRYAQYKGYDVTASADLSGYDDVAQVSSYALEALQWANAEGLVNGTSDTTLTPGGSATRSQIAVILMRFCENIAEK